MELDLSGVTAHADLETATYHEGVLYAGLGYRSAEDTVAGVFVRKRLPERQGHAVANFLNQARGAVQDGKLDLSEVLQLAVKSDIAGMLGR